ncbi:MAG: tetratricopeptide repeat protein, partial [Prolixibacteraceae bacterium]
MNTFIKLFIFLFVITLLGSCGAGKLGRDAMRSHEIGEYHKAIEQYRKASRKEKDREKRKQYAFAIAECYRQIGDYEMAKFFYNNAVLRGYEDPVAILHHADMLRASQQYEEAIENYRTYLDSVPGDERALAGLESIQKTQEWVANPTRHIINPIKEINSRESDYSPVFVAGRDNEVIFSSSRKAATGKKGSMITGQNYA